MFLGIVVKASAARVRPIATRLAGAAPAKTVDLRPNAAAICFRALRDDYTFDQSAETMTAELSREFELALFVQYDAHIGLRTARLYRRGEVAADFGECNELYVPLDENGKAEFDQPPTAFCRLDPLVEYESVRNAIELGLEALGGGSWSELKKVMGRV